MLKKKCFISSIEFPCCTNWGWKKTLHITIIGTGFMKNLTATLKQWWLYFFQMKCGFHLSVHANLQNYHIWLTNNPHVFEETSYAQLKSGSGAQFLNIESLVQFFFGKIVDSDINMKIIGDFIVLLEEDEHYASFQQDRTTAHMAEKTKFCEHRIIPKTVGWQEPRS